MKKNPQQTSLYRMSWLLLVSLLINVSLVLYFVITSFYIPFTSTIPSLSIIENKPSTYALSSSLSSVIEAMKALSFQELMAKIEDSRVVENGITLGDVALSMLSEIYYFDIERAVQRKLEKKNVQMNLGKGSLIIYFGIQGDDLEKIRAFVQKEKWPFTAEGLYRLLKRERFRENSSLKEAFFHTDPFLRSEALFARGPLQVAKEDLLELLLQVEWGQIEALTQSEKGVLDLSDSKRRDFLLSQVAKGSRKATTLFLQGDFEFALKKLNDKMAHLLLTTAEDPEKRKYAKALLLMPRSEILLKSAAEIAKPEGAIKSIAIASTAPALSRVVSKEPVKSKSVQAAPLKKGAISSSSIPSSTCVMPKKGIKKLYVISENDSLWKIAKRFSVSVEALRKENGLKTDTLQPGTSLMIPSK